MSPFPAPFLRAPRSGQNENVNLNLFSNSTEDVAQWN